MNDTNDLENLDSLRKFMIDPDGEEPDDGNDYVDLEDVSRVFDGEIEAQIDLDASALSHEQK